jgi:hypothetical protein
MRLAFVVCLASSAALAGCTTARSRTGTSPPTLAQTTSVRNAARQDRDGWKVAHFAGTPEQIGYQHGVVFADEIEDVIAAMRAMAPKETGQSWAFYRDTGQRLFWPRVPEELRDEIRGITQGVRSHGKDLDEWDILAENAYTEIAWYYIPTHRQVKPLGPGTPLPPPGATASAEHVRHVPPGQCSAFVATGSYTHGGKIVMAHNSWVSYWLGRSWAALVDITPARGHRFVMDTIPGMVHSGDDFYVSAAGLIVSETTITGFVGFDPLGIPEFVRARLAIQYARNIDEWIATMTKEGNGAYANDWLIGDRSTGEIAQLENGLKNQRVWRTRDGYFAGANYPSDPQLTNEETHYHPRADSSMEARRRRWEQLMKQYKGRIDADLAKRFMADHFDVVTGAERPSVRTLCGHGELDPDARPEWDEPAFSPGGAISSKVTDSDLARDLALWAAAGHACGQSFDAPAFLAKHPQFEWQRPALRDLPAGPWTLISGLSH